MAQILDGDNHGTSKGFISNIPRLPPKFPVNKGLLVPDIEVASYTNQINGNRIGNPHQHNASPSHSTQFRENFFWLNGLLEDSEGMSNKKGSHRRSASDSFTYLEKSRSLYRFSNIAEEDESECNAEISVKSVTKQGDQLTDLLDEIQQLQDQQNLPISVRTQPMSSSLDSSNANKTNVSRNLLEQSQERDVAAKGETFALGGCAIGGSSNAEEGSLDPKQTKRVMSNRQSAQRSRVRKLQYIAELERIVNALQMDVSSLSRQMLYHKHQQAILDMDNCTLKQRITFFLQEKNIKDSQNETLMKDVRRLRKVCEFQLIQQQQKQKQQIPKRPIHRHSSLPLDFGVQMQQIKEPNNFVQNPAPFCSPDSLMNMMKNISLSSAATNNNEKMLKEGGFLNDSLKDSTSAFYSPDSLTNMMKNISLNAADTASNNEASKEGGFLSASLNSKRLA